jgi:ATP-dependent Clp protease ATP-binding subunit ClpX
VAKDVKGAWMQGNALGMDQMNTYFHNAQSAQEYAKENPGVSIVRCEDGVGYTILSKGKQIEFDYDRITTETILDYLNEHIISQDEAKKEIALALYYHHIKYKKRDLINVRNNGPVMLIGPTGTGKTFIVQKACECVHIPFIHVDTASMVPEGIVGYCVSDLMKDILEKSNYDQSKAEHAVVFFDEIDKLFNGDSATQYGKKIAQQMLRMIEGDRVKLGTSKKHGEDVFTELNTSNMQFIFGGAFQWLLDTKGYEAPVMGFTRDAKKSRTKTLRVEDLYASGVAKEFLGRVSTIVNLKTLGREDIFNILAKSSSSPLKKYIEKIEMHGSSVSISEQTLRQIANSAANNPLGVRSIDFILKQIFKDALFDAPLHSGKVYVVDYK